MEVKIIKCHDHVIRVHLHTIFLPYGSGFSQYNRFYFNLYVVKSSYTVSVEQYILGL